MDSTLKLAGVGTEISVTLTLILAVYPPSAVVTVTRVEPADTPVILQFKPSYSIVATLESSTVHVAS
ncbi:hypothetical protein SDC9_119972 [bioreactor metagenome]|uniref:Uncharacterized protein n=1 Tax=bioreactor metagenome TaxID=1076179 RepID=A0A645C5C0_9ZZZZ